MSYPFDETFAAGVPAGFGTPVGATTATWNGAQQAVDFVSSSGGSLVRYWRLDIADTSSDFWVEADVEIVSGYVAGFWLNDGVSTGSGTVIYANGRMFYERIDSANNTGGPVDIGACAWATTGARHVLRLDVKNIDVSVYLHVFSIDGVVSYSVVLGATLPLRPGIFGYQNTLRIHRCAGGAPSALPDLTARAALDPLGRRILVPEYALPTAIPSGRGLSEIIARKDINFGGTARIAGTVKEKNAPADTPLWRRVMLIDERAKVVVRETWSDAVTGAYAFDQLDPARTYMVVSVDHLGNYRPAAADRLVPAP